MPERCDECHAQVDRQDQFQHRWWHWDQADALGDLRESLEQAVEHDAGERVGLMEDIKGLRAELEAALAAIKRLK